MEVDAQKTTKSCPMCAETIREAAVVCRFCRARLDDIGTVRMYRERNGRQIAGVAIAIAESLGVSVTLVRLAFVLTALFNGLGICAYLALWLVLPASPTTPSAIGRVLGSLGNGGDAAATGRSLFERAAERIRHFVATLRRAIDAPPPASHNGGGEESPSQS